MATNARSLGATAGSRGMIKAIAEMHGAPDKLLCPEGSRPDQQCPDRCVPLQPVADGWRYDAWGDALPESSSQQWHGVQFANTLFAKQKGACCIIVVCSQHGSHARLDPVQGAHHALQAHPHPMGGHAGGTKRGLIAQAAPGTCFQGRLGSQQVSHLRLGPALWAS